MEFDFVIIGAGPAGEAAAYIAWAWFLHFLADFTVYMVLLLAGGL